MDHVINLPRELLTWEWSSGEESVAGFTSSLLIQILTIYIVYRNSFILSEKANKTLIVWLLSEVCITF